MNDNERDIQPIRTFSKFIDAADFNTVNLALLRIGEPLTFPLKRLPLIEVSLSKRRWLCAQGSGQHIQLLAWTDFECTDRGLHEPVACNLHLYHVHAGLIMGKALQDLIAIVNAMLQQQKT